MNKLKNLLALGFGLLLAFFILEIGLRIYNPFPIRMKNGTLFLPVNRTFTFLNKHIPGLDSLIEIRNNHLGFRGTPLPNKLENYLSIIAIGGSTTECRFLSEGQDWVALLRQELKMSLSQSLWINNAGLAGNSTFGHRILLHQHISKIKPDYVIYLIGINEILRSDDFNDDLAIQLNRSFSAKDWLKKNSEIALLINNIRRSFKAYTIEAGHGRKAMELESRPHFQIDYFEIYQEINRQSKFINAYEKRLRLLLKETANFGIKPIVLTQPLLFGECKDEYTGVQLGTIASRFQYGQRYWEILENYNQITRQVARELEVPLIDLACRMPKSSRYFYDSMHFNKEGAKKVNQLLAPAVVKIIKK